MHRCLNCNRVLTRYTDVCWHCGERDFRIRDEPAAVSATSIAIHPAALPPHPAPPRRNGDRSDDRNHGRRMPDGETTLADSILAALAISANGATRHEISNLLGRNKPAAELDRAINLLIERGSIGFQTERTRGRPRTLYWLADEESR